MWAARGTNNAFGHALMSSLATSNTASVFSTDASNFAGYLTPDCGRMAAQAKPRVSSFRLHRDEVQRRHKSDHKIDTPRGFVLPFDLVWCV